MDAVEEHEYSPLERSQIPHSDRTIVTSTSNKVGSSLIPTDHIHITLMCATHFLGVATVTLRIQSLLLLR